MVWPMLCATAMPGQPPFVVEVDARGLRCPWAVLRLAKAFREGAAAVDLLSDDPAAAAEVAAFAAERGLAVTVEGERFRVGSGVRI